MDSRLLRRSSAAGDHHESGQDSACFIGGYTFSRQGAGGIEEMRVQGGGGETPHTGREGNRGERFRKHN